MFGTIEDLCPPHSIWCRCHFSNIGEGNEVEGVFPAIDYLSFLTRPISPKSKGMRFPPSAIDL